LGTGDGFAHREAAENNPPVVAMRWVRMGSTLTDDSEASRVVVRGLIAFLRAGLGA
jgi:hypothetical protein